MLVRVLGDEHLMFGRLKLLLVAIAVFAAVGARMPARAAAADVDITLDASGWSDPTVGTWDPATLTGTLGGDVVGTVHVAGATLDGAGHTVAGDLFVDRYPARGSTIRDASIVGTVTLGTSSTLTRCDVAGELFMGGSRGAVVSGNSISGAGVLAPAIYGGSDVCYVGNVFDRCALGLDVEESSPTVSANQFVACGISMWNHGATIEGNAFIGGNPAIRANMTAFDASRNDFVDCPQLIEVFATDIHDEHYTVADNYWSDWTAPDADADGVVDVPRFCGFTGRVPDPVYDATPRTAPYRSLDGMSINGGAASTVSVLASVESSRTALEMRIRNEGGQWSRWQPYAPTVAWTLSAGRGTKTVDVEYRDPSGNLMLISDSIDMLSLADQGADLQRLARTAAGSGTLRGLGNGKSATGKLQAFLAMLDKAQTLIELQRYSDALPALQSAYGLCDGLPRPNDNVTGAARAQVAARLLALIGRLRSTMP